MLDLCTVYNAQYVYMTNDWYFTKLAYFVLSHYSVIDVMKQFDFFFVLLHLLPAFILLKKYANKPTAPKPE